MFRELLKQRPRRNRKSRPKRALHLERLETRQLLAGDLVTLLPEGEFAGEGEDAPDLVAFAEAISDSRAQLFCAAWVSACSEQLELFEDGGKALPFVEVTRFDRNLNQTGIDNEITVVPTWLLEDGTRLIGSQSLEDLATEIGLSIPQSSVPSQPSLEDVTVGIGSPLHLPIDAYDPNGDVLTITVEVEDEDLLTAEILSGNRSLQIDVDGYGDMVFELFEGRAPVPTSRVIALAESGAYANSFFHRVIDGFMMQGGIVTNGTTENTDVFDDQFHLDLQHTSKGLLSFAKSTDDTNTTQFFVTDVPTRHLDFNHAVFGRLVEGDRVRDAITDIWTGAFDRPVFNVIINGASVFEDTENGVLMLRPTGNGVGTTNVSVTVTDPSGNASVETFAVTVAADTANGAPFLDPVPTFHICANATEQLTLTAQDKEGDELVFSVEPAGDTEFSLSVDEQTGVVTITPPNNFVGQLEFIASVSQVADTTTADGTDSQRVLVQVGSSHRNSDDPVDVNADNALSAIDALLVINHINSSTDSSTDDLPDGQPFLDVNGDCFVSPVDALIVINAINNLGNGEGEFAIAMNERSGEMAIPLLFEGNRGRSHVDRARHHEEFPQASVAELSNTASQILAKAASAPVAADSSHRRTARLRGSATDKEAHDAIFESLQELWLVDLE